MSLLFPSSIVTTFCKDITLSQSAMDFFASHTAYRFKILSVRFYFLNWNLCTSRYLCWRQRHGIASFLLLYPIDVLSMALHLLGQVVALLATGSWNEHWYTYLQCVETREVIKLEYGNIGLVVRRSLDEIGDTRWPAFEKEEGWHGWGVIRRGSIRSGLDMMIFLQPWSLQKYHTHYKNCQHFVNELIAWW